MDYMQLFLIILASFLAGHVFFPLIDLITSYYASKKAFNMLFTKQNPNACEGMHNWFKRDRVCQDCGYSPKMDMFLTKSGINKYKEIEKIAEERELFSNSEKQKIADEYSIDLDKVNEIEKKLNDISTQFFYDKIKENIKKEP